MNTKDAIRYTLIDLMEETGTTGSELADAVSVSKQSVSAWRTGKSSIDIENIPAICKYFGISIDEFFGSAKEKQPSVPESNLTPDEQQLVDLYRKLDADSAALLLSMAAKLAVASEKDGEDAGRPVETRTLDAVR